MRRARIHGTPAAVRSRCRLPVPGRVRAHFPDLDGARFWKGDTAMRGKRTLAIGTLAVVLLATLCASEVSAAVRGGRGVHRNVIAFGTAYVGPYYWDPFWYPGFGWGLSYSYGPYGPPPGYVYVRIPPRNAAPVELHVKPRKATVV